CSSPLKAPSVPGHILLQIRPPRRIIPGRIGPPGAAGGGPDMSRGNSPTVLYLIRHGATEANLAKPARLQGRRHNPPLARVGVRQAQATRDFLAIRPIHACYCSPLLRAVQTATIVAAPHGLAPIPVEALTECDVGRWEGLDWQTIRSLDPEGFQRFHGGPGQ